MPHAEPGLRRPLESARPLSVEASLRSAWKQLGRRQDLGGVAVDLDLGPDAGDPPVGPDQEGGPGNSQEGPAVHGFFAPDAVGLEHLVGHVGSERYVEAVLLLELVLGLDRIGGDPQNVRAGLLIFGPKLREFNGFAGAAGGVGLGVEVEHELAAVEVGEGQTAAAVARQLEGWGLCPLGEFRRHVPSFRPYFRLNESLNNMRETTARSIVVPGARRSRQGGWFVAGALQ